jgi:hypothetical protein
MDKNQRSSAARKQHGGKNLFGGRGGGLRKSRLPLISPTSYLELSSKIAPIFISTLNFLPFLNFPTNPGEGKISPDPEREKPLSFWKEWTDKYNSH